MRRIALLGTVLVALAAFLPGSAHAQASRTWISGTGDDVNPCSRTAPCKTFAGAITKTAAAGEIDCLDPGGFGGVTINKSMTIDCFAGLGGGIVVNGGNGITINAGAGTVTLRNLNIQGLGGPGGNGQVGTAGIGVLSAGAVLIDHVTVTGFGASSTPAINVSTNPCSPAAQIKIDIADTTVNNNSWGAILIAPGTGCTATASLTRVNMYTSRYGLQVSDNAKATVFHSMASNNTNNGYIAVSTASAAQIYVTNSVAANNGVHGIATSGANAAVNLDNVSIVNNGTGIDTTAGGLISGTNPATNFNVGNTTPGAPNTAAAALQ